MLPPLPNALTLRLANNLASLDWRKLWFGHTDTVLSKTRVDNTRFFSATIATH